MDRRTLRQYIPLQKEIALLEQRIDRLRERALDVPTVLGKVKGSSRDYPYIEEHITIQMDEPRESDEIRRLLAIKRGRLERAKREAVEIEELIAAIPDSVDRQIFELCFLEGLKQWEVADEVGLEQSSISKRITVYLQLSCNS